MESDETIRRVETTTPPLFYQYIQEWSVSSEKLHSILSYKFGVALW